MNIPKARRRYVIGVQPGIYHYCRHLKTLSNLAQNRAASRDFRGIFEILQQRVKSIDALFEWNR